jgi:hypothetical protein
MCSLLLVLFASSASAQIFTNNGAKIRTYSGSIVKIVGSLWNKNTGATPAVIDNTLGTITITEDFTNDGLGMGTQAGGSGTYYVAGHWINNATWVRSTGTVGMNSDDSQHFKGSQVTTFNNLLIQNGGLKRLLINERVDGVMDFQSGVVFTTEAYLLTHTVNGSWINGLTAASYIDGPAAKDFPDVLGGAFRYNIGKYGRVNTCQVTPMSTASCTWRTEYFPQQFFDVTSVISPLVNVSRVHYWHGDRTAGSTDIMIRLYWIPGDYQQSYITDPSQLVVARWTTPSGNNAGGTYPPNNAGAWQNFGNTDYNGNWNQGDVRSFSTATYPVTTFVTPNQPWTIASITSLNGLPVELGSYTARQFGDRVQLEWKTESETNNLGFEIERRSTTDDHGYLVKSFTYDNELRAKDRDGAKYQTFDTPPAPGEWTYDLLEVDLDGTTKLIGTQTVEFMEYTPSHGASASVFPNPSSSKTGVAITLAAPSDVTLAVYDLAGSLRFSHVETGLPMGISEVPLDLSSLTPGTYSLVVRTLSGTARTIFVVSR